VNLPFIAGKDGPAVNVESFCAMPVPLKIIWTFAPSPSPSDAQWIGLRENLQETIDFPIKYGAFRLNFSLKPIH
jgi:hypothetical protein